MKWDLLEWFRLRFLKENCSDHKCCIQWSNISVQLFLYFWHLRAGTITGLTRCQSHTSCVTSSLTVGQWWGHSQIMISSPKLSRDQSAVCFVSTRISNSIPWMKSDHNGSANLHECRLLLATPASIPKLLPDTLLTSHHPGCLHLECDWVRLNFCL